MIGDEAEILAAGLHCPGFGLELFPGLVEIQLLVSEFESVAAPCVSVLDDV